MTTKATTNATSSNTKVSVDNYRKGRTFQIVAQESQYDQIEGFIDYIENLSSFQYILITEHDKEDDGNLNPHRHIYIQLNQCRTLSKKALGTLHCEPCYASAQANYEYLMCLDEKHKELNVTAKKLYENGKMLTRGGYKLGEIKKMDPSEIDNMDIRIKRLAKEAISEYQEEQAFEKMLDEIDNDDLKPKNIIYITGGTGKGKTYQAYKRALLDYEKSEIGRLKLDNNFMWSNKYQAKCLVIEEFRPSQYPASEFLQLTDKYVYTGPIKHGYETLYNLETLIICSVKKIDEIYKDEINQQFKRRVTEYYKMTDHGKFINLLSHLQESQHLDDTDENEDYTEPLSCMEYQFQTEDFQSMDQQDEDEV